MTIKLLESAFGNCKRRSNSRCPVSSSYESVSLTNFYIYDERINERDPVVLIDDEQRPHQLKVVNNSGSAILFVKTDKCLFTDGDGNEKCDCLLLNDKQFYLIEISETSKGNRGTKRRKAVAQLSRTIELLKDAGIKFEDYQSEAVICFRSGATRPTQASNNSQKAIFKEQHNVHLVEGNKITFN